MNALNNKATPKLLCGIDKGHSDGRQRQLLQQSKHTVPRPVAVFEERCELAQQLQVVDRKQTVAHRHGTTILGVSCVGFVVCVCLCFGLVDVRDLGKPATHGVVHTMAKCLFLLGSVLFMIVCLFVYCHRPCPQKKIYHHECITKILTCQGTLFEHAISGPCDTTNNKQNRKLLKIQHKNHVETTTTNKKNNQTHTPCLARTDRTSVYRPWSRECNVLLYALSRATLDQLANNIPAVTKNCLFVFVFVCQWFSYGVVCCCSGQCALVRVVHA